MSKSSSIIMWIVAVLFSGVYFFPLWQITLEAPQYPQGLGIHIWVDEITGAEPHDLQNINGLNHYIGMKAIEPDAIPELRYMKFIAGLLIASAALVALLRKKALLVAWVAVAVLLSAVGMADFYKWEYDYGHDLDPNAAIKVPGMSYQPPLLGTKQLLNFRTTAWPGLGGVAAMLAVALAGLTALRELWGGRGRRRHVHRAVFVPAALALALVLSACSKSPQPIAYGSDQCAYCMMTITDDRYGTEIVSAKGRAYKFDSIECMVGAVKEGEKITADEAERYYVADYAEHGNLFDATTAAFLVSEKLPSPMGANLTGFAARAAAEAMREARGGEILDWHGVWLRLGAAPADDPHAGHAH
jgi:copper chaperone NosL